MTTIILPAYNEAKKISFIKTIPKRYKILVVDDGSTDGTSKIVQKLGYRCLTLEKNMGKGYACRFGAEYVKVKPAEKLVFMDGDAQFFPEDIAILEKALDSCDLVVGQRKSFSSLSRRASNKLASKLINIGLDDVLCGFRAIRKDDFLKLNLKRNRYEIEAEMLIKAKKLNFRVSGVHVKVQESESKMRFRDMLRTAWFIISRKFDREIII